MVVVSVSPTTTVDGKVTCTSTGVAFSAMPIKPSSFASSTITITGASGPVVSTNAESSPVGETLPALSVRNAVTVKVKPSGGKLTICAIKPAVISTGVNKTFKTLPPADQVNKSPATASDGRLKFTG